MLREVKSFAVRLWKDEQGASLLEYSVLIGLILCRLRCGSHGHGNLGGRPVDRLENRSRYTVKTNLGLRALVENL